ncbi:MAG: hypothetical protein OEZ38_01100 [Gammaproteobacteria bacterium]|nr:hypothetical protein [Gammaproteobacteria bacterium]
MSVEKNRKSMKKQRGAALLLFFVTLLMVGSVVVVSNISSNKSKVKNEDITTASLAEAREALIAYAVTYYDTQTTTAEPKAGLMGYLPCPDDGTATEGQSSISCGSQYENRLGRLPWKKMGIQALKDGSGNCLWYAVSGEYKDIGPVDRARLNNAAGLTRSEMINDDSKGAFRLYDKSGNLIKGSNPDDRIVAVIIAPGREIQTQNRNYIASTQCGNDYDATQFLEVFNGIDNTSVTAVSDAIDDFIVAERTNDDEFNDRFITISQQEIFDEIKKRSSFGLFTSFDDLMINTTRELAECLAEYGLNNSSPPAGCDNACMTQCAADRTSCYNQCDNCRVLCNDARDACIAAGTNRNICNRDRNDCRNACPRRNVCRAACDATYNTCILGGSGGNDFRLPWPAPLALVDYRDSQQYIEDTVSGNLLGRFPVDVGNPLDINNSLSVTGNSGGRYLLENDYTGTNIAYTHCQNFNTDAAGTYNSVERRIWENWKDHFFYGVAQDFSTAAAAPTPVMGTCANCLTVDGNGPYVAVVIYSSERLNSQQRTTNPDAEAKNNLANYLEADNINGDTVYESFITNPAMVNDILFCIDENMIVSNCQ